MPDVKKAWPQDALIILASNPVEANRAGIALPMLGKCRHCGGPVLFDLRSLERANVHPARRGRPVQFFCIPCAVQHEFPNVLEDLRR